ncbi:phosphate ABC transporter substrate-binding protein, PhoT family [Aliiroseovarius halocynthiae]|uniref:phosphate ABC transporter substrate-binding/OmpA family protein n=1 Tax=Aliiroseovarius halocynthiae TaxID=985055 RepID=UPI001FEA3393|nr:phosphate ABC transporter substrate-binding/OmpA family protein [Aliiroseovarius halocynthiae]SMR82493.1 phosphate ABC transporter substrate-binding protein, PhoT family [Aliiroseovarius halocynthiae]
MTRTVSNTLLRLFRVAIASVLIAGSAAQAQDVTLTSRDGTIELTGYLLTFDGEFYRVDTEFGILTIDSSGVSCDGPGCPSLGPFVAELTISGAHNMGAVLFPALVEGFALRKGYALKREEIQGVGTLYSLLEGGTGQEVARFTIKLTTSSEGFADLLSQQADMVLSMRQATTRERSLARDAGLGDLRIARQSRVAALDALVPIVSPGNPVTKISISQLAAIYAGKIQNWSELGGEDAPITPYMMDIEEGFGPVFMQDVIAAQGATLSDRVVIHPTSRTLADAIARDPFGIAMTTYTQRGSGEVVELSGGCGFSVHASRASIKSEDYPLTMPMFLYLPERRLPQVGREFLSYLRTDSAQFVTRRAGFVDQALTRQSIRAQGDRMANAVSTAGEEVTLEELQRMVRTLNGHERLSISFRFEGGSTLLDAPSRSNVALLAEALESGRFDGKQLSFIGFSDGQGAAEQNRNLSERRARAVRDQVLAQLEAFDPARVQMLIDAFGEAMPMACDDSAWGRSVNRRVEIWVN